MLPRRDRPGALLPARRHHPHAHGQMPPDQPEEQEVRYYQVRYFMKLISFFSGNTGTPGLRTAKRSGRISSRWFTRDQQAESDAVMCDRHLSEKRSQHTTVVFHQLKGDCWGVKMKYLQFYSPSD